MSTEAPVVGTALLVCAGRWSAGQPIDISVAIGLGAYTLCIAGVTAANERLGTAFSILVLVAAFGIYLQPIITKIGLTGGAAGAPGTGPIGPP